MVTDRIGIGLVGAGWMGNEHSQAYRRIPETWPDANFEPVLVHVADNVPAVAEASARRWGYMRSSTDWRAVIDDPEVDVVDITGPNGLHREVALAAAAAGKHVGCEKPLGRTAAEAAEIAAAVARAGVRSNCNFQYRHNPAIQYVRQLVAAGKLGQITHLRGAFLTDFGWTRMAHSPGASTARSPGGVRSATSAPIRSTCSSSSPGRYRKSSGSRRRWLPSVSTER